MHGNWQETYAQLTAFVSEHQDIRIEQNKIRIPDDWRTQFYNLFDNVREDFLEEKFSPLLAKATILDENYERVKNEVSQLLGLDNISMNPDLLRFLNTPAEQLIRVFYEQLFNLLKGSISTEAFESEAIRNIEASFYPLYLAGYEKWVVLTLLKLLDAAELFHVVYQEATLYDAHKGGGLIQEQISNPENTSSISFQYAPDSLLTVPDLIIRSPRIDNKCVAFRSQIGEAFGVATGISPKRDYFYFDTSVELHPYGTFICIGDDANEVSLIADEKRICRPDLIIGCIIQGPFDEEKAIARIKLQHDILKPKMGTYIVSDIPLPEDANNQLGNNIHILNVGFEQFMLNTIVDALSG